jgi:hypothetical protein
LKDDATLRVSKDCPGDTTVLELIDADFAGEGTVGLIKDVLRCYFEAFAEMFTGEKEIKSWWGDDNLYSISVSLLLATTSEL